MPSNATRLSDIVLFNQYVTSVAQNVSEEKSKLIQSGAVVRNAQLDNFLRGMGNTISLRTWRDLDPTTPVNISNDDPNDHSTPNTTSAFSEKQVRLERNVSWSSMDIVALLKGADPMDSIANMFGLFLTRQDERLVLATMKGLFANNDAYNDGDFTNNISKTAFAEGVTNFTAAAFIDTTLTMGDSMDSLGMIMVHPVTFGSMLKQNLIDYIEPSVNARAYPEIEMQPTYLGKRIIVTDMMPTNNGVFETWVVGSGVLQMGAGSPQVPIEVDRIASAGRGSGQDIVHYRWSRVMHPIGYSWQGVDTQGGPSDDATVGNIAHPDSWKRVWPERKQIPIARLVHREY